MVAGSGVVVGLVLVLSGALKARAPAWPALAAGFGLPRPLAPVLPWLEIVLGALLAAGIARPWTAAAALGVLTIFTIAIAGHLARGHRVPCGCFGEARPEPVGPADLLRNVVLSALAVIAMGLGGAPVRWAAGGAIALAAGAWVALRTLSRA